MPALRGLKIQDAMIHDVPRPGDPELLTLTDAAVTLDEPLESYFLAKLKESLRVRGLEVVAEAGLDDTVRQGVCEILGNSPAHVSASQRMAEHLYGLQSKTNSPGLLVVFRAAADSGSCLAVLKLEREVGVHFKVTEQEGHNVIDLAYLRDLTLTRKTRVFKAAVLWLDIPADANTMAGVASDDQRSREEGRGIARFFLQDFLGCKLRHSPDQATQEFWKGAQTFIQNDVQPPERQGRYQIAVQAYLEEPEQDLNPETFIRRAIDEAHQPVFRQRLRDEGLDPGGTYGKDTGLIEKKITGFRLAFEHGMVLVGDREDLEERVDLPSDKGPAREVRIKDTIKRFSGR